MAVSKRLRMEILRRDNYTCRYCGGSAPDVKLTIDHVTPIALGGSDEPGNLVAACFDCNAGKASVHPESSVVEDVTQDAMRWAAAIKEAARLVETERQKAEDLYAAFDSAWVVNIGAYRYRPDDWRNNLVQFTRAGLSYAEIEDAVFVTARKYGLVGSDYWRYFCGVCWRKVDKLNEVAKSLLTKDEADS